VNGKTESLGELLGYLMELNHPETIICLMESVGPIKVPFRFIHSTPHLRDQLRQYNIIPRPFGHCVGLPVQLLDVGWLL